MNLRRTLGRGGFGAAACVACCAPPIVGALGITAGVAATVGLFLGLAAAIAVTLIGAAWIGRLRSRHYVQSKVFRIMATPPSISRRSEADSGSRASSS